MITSLVYQRPVGLLQQYEFFLNWLPEGETISHPYIAIVTVSHREGITTIVDISIEGDLPEDFSECWDPDWAIKQIMFELGEELNKIQEN